MALCELLRDGLVQLHEIDRLGHVQVEAGVQRGLAVGVLAPAGGGNQ